MKTMDEYIHEQPTVLRDILQKRKTLVKAFADHMADLQPDRLYLIASGSSLNAAKAGADFMQEALGIEVQAHAASYPPVIRGERPLIVFISQGGSSTNTLAAIEALSAYPSVALTGNDNCRINEVCDAHVSIGCGPESAGPKTKGYTATVLSLYLMALEAALRQGCMEKGAYDAYIKELDTSITDMSDNILKTENWFRDNSDGMIPLKKCCVVGKHLGSQTALEGALKLMETLLIPASAYEFEEFLHGPSMAIDPDMGGVYLAPDKDDPDYNRIIKLAQYHRSICPMVYIVGKRESDDGKNCVLKWGAWYTGVFAWILPCQAISANLPVRLGIAGKGSERFQSLDKILNIKYKGGV